MHMGRKMSQNQKFIWQQIKSRKPLTILTNTNVYDSFNDIDLDKLESQLPHELLSFMRFLLDMNSQCKTTEKKRLFVEPYVMYMYLQLKVKSMIHLYSFQLASLFIKP